MLKCLNQYNRAIDARDVNVNNSFLACNWSVVTSRNLVLVAFVDFLAHSRCPRVVKLSEKNSGSDQRRHGAGCVALCLIGKYAKTVKQSRMRAVKS